MLDLHDETKNISADAATETHENLLLLTDIKGRGFLVVEGAPGYVVSAPFFESDILRHEGDNIDRIPHVIQNAIRVKGHRKNRCFFRSIKTTKAERLNTKKPEDVFRSSGFRLNADFC